ncbi:1-deoxy-D-xylulose-5-phosphate reductoisomerase [Psittacicella hinzii]|uniref:1-deoxy-D-xylulose 5-phosphate reductoisomerase n=1 Tax=Psittacicella hinzii TaxID=2028575 RepID=A0A3A1YB62_9GAMM|nr:1-deoxy-D-xylulose-5-phosphate reductoisomerase [Psittacicella hinzii]RIY33424.1 1-deoxy-D-xylulose-5-phosphate reductoisomerase [Psittacicella hinzii]
MQRNIHILGSTGSIGNSTLKVLSYQLENKINPHNQIKGLYANSSVDKLVEQVKTYKPKYCGLFSIEHIDTLKQKLQEQLTEQEYNDIIVVSGEEEISKVISSEECDLVVGAIVGFAGLKTSLTTLKAGKELLLANKESLVVGGHLIKQALKENKKAKLIPVDSEHNAIFQCLDEKSQQNICFCDLKSAGVNKIMLTASGGPFLHLDLDKFDSISPEMALKHPNWSMGAKITIDSSTLMNKGLEFIEACVLFNCDPDDIQTVIHPQSIVHSGVEYLDKSILVQMGPTDMCVPIAYALNYPERQLSSVDSLDLYKLQGLTFFPVDYDRYPNFALAVESIKLGYTYTCALNAANEVAVEAFLQRRIKYTDIFKYNKLTLEQIKSEGYEKEYFDYSMVEEIDRKAREYCTKFIEYAS